METIKGDKLMKKRVLIALLIAVWVLGLAGAAAAGSADMGGIPVTVAIGGVTPGAAESYIISMTPDVASNPMPEGTADGVFTLAIDGPGSGAIPGMTFTRMGHYTYTIRQIPVRDGRAYVYDDTEYKLNVWVTRNTTTNAYEANYWLDGADEASKPDACAFLNLYPTPVTHDPPVKKIITGGTPAVDSTFTFRLTAKSNTAGFAVDAMPMPGGEKATSMTMTITGAQEKEFGVITFDTAGTYEYEVSEVNNGADGYTYDTGVYKLTYVITLNRQTGAYEKALTVTRDGAVYEKSVFEFTNVYRPDEPELPPKPVAHDSLRVRKAVTGDTPTTVETFQFALTAKSNTAGLNVADMPMPAASSAGKKTIAVKAGAEEKVGSLTFTLPGTYVYELTEVNTNVANYTYDKAVYRLTYEVAAENGALVIRGNGPTITKDGAAVTEAALSFTNKYTKPTEPGTNTSTMPKTGVQDYWPYMLGGACLLLLAAAIMILYLRRSRSGK